MQLNRLSAALSGLLLLVAHALRADGTTDFVLDPAATYTISAPGSYRLTGGATMTAGKTAISITSRNVTLDLNGHTITSAGGGATGIVGTQPNISISNGALADFSAAGINLTGADARVADVTLRNTGAATGPAVGIGAGGVRARVERCSVAGVKSGDDTATGISVAGADSRVIDCTVTLVDAGAAAASIGILASGDGGVLEGNQLSDVGSGACQTATGIQSKNGRVARNTLQRTGESATSIARGIAATGTGAVLIEDNTLRTVGGPGTGKARGIETEQVAAAAARISGNLVGNVLGSVSADGIIGRAPGHAIEGNTVEELSAFGDAASISQGIAAADSSEIRRNRVRGLTTAGVGSGVIAGEGCTIGGNIVADLSAGGFARGIEVEANAIVEDNLCRNIDTTAGNVIGISASIGCVVEGNTVAECAGPAFTGINLSVGAGEIRGNRISQNRATSAQATGIQVVSGVLIEGNIVTGNRESEPNDEAAIGIDASSDCTVRGNQCYANGTQGAAGRGFGIRVGTGCVIENNTCSGNDGAGATGSSAGILVFGQRNRIVNNSCDNQSGGGAANGNVGILVSGVNSFGNLIAGNTTNRNSTRGITILAAGNRTEANRSADGAILGGSGLAGDLADIAY